MAPVNAVHTRSHSLLLLQKLLNLRDGASPLTLLLDNLEQPATPVVSEFITRAKLSRTKVILLSFATIKKPRDVDVVIKATGKDFQAIRKELLSHYPNIDPAAAAARDRSSPRAVVIIDSLNTLSSAIPQALASFLSGIITPAVSIVAVYHTDVPVLLPAATFSEYEPAPLTVLCHLATAILRLASLPQEIARQRARDKALVEPEWGLREGREGVLIGLQRKAATAAEAEERNGVVLTMELRRRSGRTVTETFVLARPDGGKGTGKLLLRSDHPVFATPGAAGEEEEEGPESTFNLGLTEKQRKDREGIVLPYFDAQTEVGGGDGGRILYDMGREDDFDEEEDEI
ncbi:hypothetical protein LMH87_002806 [Akanthomyces muscarius]|uniref:Elongator complex protein 5 n=1 Tax=Akanthomyces muscarius TaxID=2231603 RepID=A0A9W8UIX3_AKAMU|nr:hypothetical protein LMH87_002806 [Akanthomyces muscarius]KAJ4148330.1 hypothetical protein LMH87_002806 [Akanthomyces muscarius]